LITTTGTVRWRALGKTPLQSDCIADALSF
jgi:hypothetical protein